MPSFKSLCLSAAAAAALAATSLAQAVQFTNSDYSGITAGPDAKPFPIGWSGDGTPVDIMLLTGPSTDLKNVSTVASSATSSPFSWTPSSTLTDGLYALSISQSGSINYSPQFEITGGTGTGTTTSTTPAADDGADTSVNSAVNEAITPPTNVPTPAYVANGGLEGNSTTGGYYGAASASASAGVVGGGLIPFEGRAAGRMVGMVGEGVVLAVGVVVGGLLMV